MMIIIMINVTNVEHLMRIKLTTLAMVIETLSLSFHKKTYAYIEIK